MKTWSLLFFLSALLSGNAYANKKFVQLSADSSITIDYKIDSEPAKDGGAFSGRFLISIPEGWHLYGKGAVGHAPLMVKLADETKNSGDNFYYPKPVVRKIGGEELPIYEGETVINFTSAGTGSAENRWDVVVSWQACSSSICLRPHKELISLNLGR